jgi:voltage-gated potassium channel
MVKKIKRRVYSLIRDDDVNNLAASVVDGVIIFLILINVALIITDTFRGLPASVHRVFHYVELTSVVIFTVEYLLRVWISDLSHPAKTRWRSLLRYALSPSAIIDLLSILPFYLPFIFPIDMRVLRLLRIMKVNRYTDAFSTVGNVVRRKSAQLMSSVIVMLIMMIISSVLMYNIESGAQPEVFKNAFSGLWWAIATLTTVGYGDIYPITILGKLLGAIIALLGVGLVAVPTGIISAGFVEQTTDNKPRDDKQYCPHCGKKIN